MPNRLAAIARSLNPVELFLGPVFQRDMRVLGRRKGTYWTRALYALALLVFCAMFYMAQVVDARHVTGASRLQQFQNLAPLIAAALAWFQLAAVVLVAPVLTGPLVCDEKRNRTISALATSPIPALHIIWAGVLSRLVQLTILMLIAAPLMLALRAFGGLDVELIAGVTALTASAGFLAASLGAWSSVHAKKPWSAAASAFLFMFVINFLPLILWGVANYYPRLGLGPLVDASSVLTTFFAMLMLTIPEASRGMPFGGPGMWITVTVGNIVAGGVVCVIAAWQLRRVLVREAAETPAGATFSLGAPQAGASRLGRAGPTVRQRLRATIATWRRSTLARIIIGIVAAAILVLFVFVGLTSDDAYDPPMILAAWAVVLGFAFALPVRAETRTVGDAPVLWRETRQAPFGAPLIALVVALGAGLCMALAYANGGAREEGLAIPLVCISIVILAIHTAAAAGGTIAGEVQSRTWSALLTTPLTPREIIRGKIFGLVRRQWMIPAFVAVHLGVVTLAGTMHPIAAAVVMVNFVYAVVFLASLGVAMSLWLRRSTPATIWTLVVAAGLWGVLPMLSMLAAAILQMDRSERPSMHLVSLVIAPNPVVMAAVATEGGMNRGGWKGEPRFDFPTGGIGLAMFLFYSTAGWSVLLAASYALSRWAERHFPKAAAADR